MAEPDDTASLVTCPNCEAEHFVADLDFPEPDDDTNTQFGWLVARCPDCNTDIKVGLDLLGDLFE